jgi:hypothetical protein
VPVQAAPCAAHIALQLDAAVHCRELEFSACRAAGDSTANAAGDVIEKHVRPAPEVCATLPAGELLANAGAQNKSATEVTIVME